VRRFGLLGFCVTVVVIGLVAVGVLTFSPLVARFYTPDPALIPLVTAGLALCSLFYVADGLQVVGANALRAQSDVWIPTLTHTFSYAVVMCPLAWALALPGRLGLAGIVWAVIVASFLAAAFLLSRFWWVSRRLI
jgi:MATE family multidrug resistance protein